MKRVLRTAFTGESGINLIQRVVQEMHCLWHPRGPVEAGIDGTIEIVDPVTDEATNQIITVQSKATLDFAGETPEKVEFLCKEQDLNYWMQGNTPVILVYSKPTANEAYWVSIKDYFADPRIRTTRKIIFSKLRDKFDKDARAPLLRIAIPRDAGLYLGLPAKEEPIYSDLVPVRNFPPRYCTAPTEFKSGAEITRLFRSKGPDFPRAWVYHGKMVFSFDPLDNPIWRDICDCGAIEENSTDEWARIDDEARKRLFVQLLNVTLRDQLFHQGVLYNERDECYYERAEEDLQDKRPSYSSRTRRSRKTTFKMFSAEIDGKSYSYCRHSAFRGAFLRFDYVWHLHIEPTYHYTTDGFHISPLAGEKRSGMKRLEKNQAIHGNVLIWARRLQQQSSWKVKPKKLFFAEPLQFKSVVGFDDSSWIDSDAAVDGGENE